LIIGAITASAPKSITREAVSQRASGIRTNGQGCNCILNTGLIEKAVLHIEYHGVEFMFGNDLQVTWIGDAAPGRKHGIAGIE
jgi:hypothetical protein